MIPIFGGRRWTALWTASLLIPARGIGFAVQSPATTCNVFPAPALLWGLGGRNFASFMANIAYFHPKTQKGNALALNAGLADLGASAKQFTVPSMCILGCFRRPWGQPQVLSDGGRMWLHSAGFIRAPFWRITLIAA